MIEREPQAGNPEPAQNHRLDYRHEASRIPAPYGLFWFSFIIAAIAGLPGSVVLFRDLMGFRRIDGGDIIALGCLASVAAAVILLFLRTIIRGAFLQSAIVAFVSGLLAPALGPIVYLLLR